MTIHKILAVIDMEEDEQTSLTRSILISQYTGASITAFLSIYDFSYEMTTMLSMDERENMRQAVIDERTEWLQKLIRNLSVPQGIAIDIKVVWHNRPYESIIYTAIDEHYDFIVKGTKQHDSLKSVIFTPTDWHIMRKAPVPVLLVKEHAWPEHGQILAAINAGSDVLEHQSLNARISQQALYFAKLLKSNVHLVNAFPGTPQNIVIELPEFNTEQYTQNIQRHHEKSLLEHASKLHIPEKNCHVREGLPEDVIPKLAKEIDAELVIIGTVGRVGISAALIGNTAEHVIDKLDCDVLAIKPEGFVSPVRC